MPTSITVETEYSTENFTPLFGMCLSSDHVFSITRENERAGGAVEEDSGLIIAGSCYSFLDAPDTNQQTYRSSSLSATTLFHPAQEASILQDKEKVAGKNKAVRAGISWMNIMGFRRKNTGAEELFGDRDSGPAGGNQGAGVFFFHPVA